VTAATSADDLAGLLTGADRVLAFTGAGISTESGIPDFRSPGGVWTRFNPADFTFGRYVESARVRERSWQMRRELLADGHAPNAGRLETGEREVMCIGHAPRHGIPDGCGFRAPVAWAFERVDAGDTDPSCPLCGGLVKSAVVSFEQVLFPHVVAQAEELVGSTDLLLAVGSSLVVHPAASLPLLALRNGARLAIVNDEPTPYDDLADVVVRGRAGAVLPAAVGAVLD
jgi:NAD-dependent deacetylase